MKVKRSLFVVLCMSLFCFTSFVSGQSVVSISIPDQLDDIDPMIYGQMLEDCNDSVIYGGLIRGDGTEHPVVNDLLKPLNMPIVRWPAGTYIHEYNWENGIGPKESRPTVDCICWGGQDTNIFGTDEFLQWCKRIGTVPYINFNMSNNPKYAGSLGDALNWLEYVNGSANTAYGMKRVQNGHQRPYNVKYWCIGNENYGPYGVHKAETAEVYSDKLYQWAKTIRSLYPDLKLLGVGHLYGWNDTVLSKNGALIDFLTLHYYMGAQIKENVLMDPAYTIFAPAKVEANIKKSAERLGKENQRLGRTDCPIRFSIDEWNNRHAVYDGVKFGFTRKDSRRLFDVATVAGMLNVFIRQSPAVGMANYIFPVNGHGLIKTVGDDDAYKTPVYYVFELYRHYMIGKKIDMEINGSGLSLPLSKLKVEGDINRDVNEEMQELKFIDGAAVLTKEGNINITLINRSHEKGQKVKVNVPDGYFVKNVWTLEADDINVANVSNDRNRIVPKKTEINSKKSQMDLTLSPCGFSMIQYSKVK